MKTFLTTAFFCIAAATSAVAQSNSQQVLCKMNTAGTNNWIAPDILLIYANDGSQVAVLDGLVFSANDEKPIAANILSRTQKEMRFVWKLDLQSLLKTPIKAQYNATLNGSRTALTVNATLIGTPQSEFSRGKCAPYKG